MSVNLDPLHSVSRLLFAVPLEPVQGSRFQPTGFPGLGPATFQTSSGQSLLVESAQSMANRLEMTCWDDAQQDLVQELKGLSHVRVERKGVFLTDTILEAHRLNSPYLLKGKDKSFMTLLKQRLGALEQGPIDRRKLAEVLLKLDIGSLLHGVFLAQKELAGGRLRVARALSAFIEADGVRVAPSGGVKNDHVFPQGDASEGFGNVPFARDEFTADRLTLYVNLDLSQIRGYGLDESIERLLVLLALYKLRSLLSGSLRLRTACDLQVVDARVTATNAEFDLPSREAVMLALRPAIDAVLDQMSVTVVTFEDELVKKDKGKGSKAKAAMDDDEQDASEDAGE